MDRKMEAGIRDRYETLKQKVSARKKPFDKFIGFLEKKTAWLTSPASTKYHLSEEGGLLKHSIGVAECLLKLRETLALGISEESCVIVGLLHDVGKVGMPGKPFYLPREHADKGGRGAGYVVNTELATMGHAVRSLYLIAKYVPLSDSEAQARASHDGQYNSDDGTVCGRQKPLTLLVHWADYWCSHVCEEGRGIGD